MSFHGCLSIQSSQRLKMLFPQFTVYSGGQTGVDQGALEAAIDLGIPHGGWCPKGRRSETGAIPEYFILTEHKSSKYNPRTKQNTKYTDGTLLLGWGAFCNQGPGTKFTDDCAHQLGKPCLYKNIYTAYTTTPELDQAILVVIDWLQSHNIYLLNVAGSRESNNPGIQ